MNVITSNCLCDGSEPWQVIYNTPGLSTVRYRVGDFLTFRHELLLPLSNEQELKNWHPSARGDLALQMVEWWAYLADILTFYNERIANQSYLRTADLDENVKRLIRILGYRPRPGIGAYGVVAALMSKPSPTFTLPRGFPIQSKPGPGKQPQIFEVFADTPISYPDAVNVDIIARPVPLAAAHSILLKGSVTSLKADDELLLLDKQWQSSHNYAVVTVQSTNQEKDPRGNINTRVTFTTPIGLTDPGASAAHYRLLKSSLSVRVWQYAAAGIALRSDRVHLDAITRQIKVGDPLVFEDLSKNNAYPWQLTDVNSYKEEVWYANPKDPSHPDLPPDPSTTKPPVPIPHTVLSFASALRGSWHETTTLIHYAWKDVGQLIESPSATLSDTSAPVAPVAPAAFPEFTSGQQLQVLLEDANGYGAQATAVPGPAGQFHLTELNTSAPAPLTAPFRVLFDLLPVTRGKTVPREILGSGDATSAGPEFTLQNSPLTYLLSNTSTSGSSYASTLKIMVNNIEWKEVPSFYDQPPTAQVFVTREDEQNVTHVQFGDGINGARLPSGVNNVVATYRYGSGADAPDAGQLTVLTKAWPNLKALRNPVAVGGGANPDSAKKIRQYAPQSVLTFGRAVSADDYETIAAQAPGVARARSYWAWNAEQQRSLVTIYVGDDASAVVAAQTALNGAADPNRPVAVLPATPLPMIMHLALQINPRYDPDVVKAAVAGALLDDDTGLFGLNVIRIGRSIYQSQIYAACMGVPGVQSANILSFLKEPRLWFNLALIDRIIEYNPALHYRPFSRCCTCREGIRYNPGEDGFFQLTKDRLSIDTEVSAHGR